jgi:CheY-like chemotaxis protein
MTDGTQPTLRMLLVEDEALIAMMAEDMIDGLGHRVVRTATTLADALAACAENGFDAALLDVNLNGDTSMEVATALKARGCPFAFTTGYGAGGVDPAHSDCPVLTKPYALGELEILLTGFVAQFAGTSSITSSVDSNRG